MMWSLYLSHQQRQGSDSFLQSSDFLSGAHDQGRSRVNNSLATRFAQSQLVANCDPVGQVEIIEMCCYKTRCSL